MIPGANSRLRPFKKFQVPARVSGGFFYGYLGLLACEMLVVAVSMKSMKALLLAENWPPRTGGIENYLTHIATLLPKGSVTVVAPIAEDKVGTGNEEGNSGIKEVIRKRFFWPFLKPAWLPLWLFIKKLAAAEKFDVILCGKALFEGLVAYRLKKLFDIPYIVFTYAMEIEVWARETKTKKKLIQVLLAADRVVYINEETKKTLLQLGVLERQLVKVWPGVDDGYFNEQNNEDVARVIATYNLKQPYIFAFGRLVPRKGFDVLIDAFAKLDQMKFPHLQLVIAGDGPERKNLEGAAKRNFLDASVKFLGFVPQEDVVALYSGAKIFALTPRVDASDIEGFGIVYMEAAACGVPAIGTRIGGVPEAIEHNVSGLVVAPDSSKDVADALALLLSDEQLRSKLGAAARKRAWDDFRWSKRILLVKGMIDAILAERFLRSVKP